MIDVLIVDEYPIVREGLVSLMSRTDDIRVAGQATNADEALILVRAQRFDVVVLDISLPGRCSLDVLTRLLKESPELRVLILSSCPENQFALRSLRIGAQGYLTKEVSTGEIVAAIRIVAGGKTYVNDALGQQLSGSVDIDIAKPLHESLSDREFEIMCMLGQGKRVADIASILSLSVATVHTYRARIFAKMNLESNAELILYVLDNHLLHGR